MKCSCGSTKFSRSGTYAPCNPEERGILPTYAIIECDKCGRMQHVDEALLQNINCS
ncbi:MAG: hypothetical protein WC525_09980 [Candidatus Thermoplasmatota archaeon]